MKGRGNGEEAEFHTFMPRGRNMSAVEVPMYLERVAGAGSSQRKSCAASCSSARQSGPAPVRLSSQFGNPWRAAGASAFPLESRSKLAASSDIRNLPPSLLNELVHDKRPTRTSLHQHHLRLLTAWLKVTSRSPLFLTLSQVAASTQCPSTSSATCSKPASRYG